MTTSLAAEDELAIRNLYASYCHLMDTGDAKAWCDCFVRDGVLSIPTQSVRIQGRENLARFADGYRRSTGGRDRHVVMNIVLEAQDSNQTSGAAYLVVFTGGRPPQAKTTGIYRDRLRREQGRWRFATRELLTDENPE